MININCKKTLFFVLLSVSTLGRADLPTWNIVPKESSLSFTATQNGAPVTGQFKTFSGEIKGDPAQLENCSIKIVVDINSLSDAYNQLAETLKSAEWFNAKLFPQAFYSANLFVKTGDKTYEAKGKLTIRNLTHPVTLTFTQEDYTGVKGQVKGSTMIKRSDFAVGTGEWADTKTIKDEVRIDFTLTATKQQ